MKKFVIASVTALLTLALLASCADKKVGPDDTQKPAATAPTTTGQADNEPTSTTPQTSDVPTDTDATTQKLTLNEDIFTANEKTYDQLLEKYGKVVDCMRIEGGLSFAYENGYGFYSFYGEPREPVVVIDMSEEKGPYHSSMLPKEDFKVLQLSEMKTKSLFIESFDTITVDELVEAMENAGMKYKGTDKYVETTHTFAEYASKFEYTFTDGSVAVILVGHNFEDIVDSDSNVEIYFPEFSMMGQK